MPIKFASVAAAFALLLGAGAASANEGGHAGWQRQSDNEIGNLPSLQRGARNFMAYCSGCHSLRFMRYSRLAEDLKIPDDQRDQFLVPASKKYTDYLVSSMPAKDAAEWFGRAPPDLSLVARSRGSDWFSTSHQLLRRSGEPPDRRQQPAAAGHGDAACVGQRAGRANAVWRNEEQLARTASRSRHACSKIRARCRRQHGARAVRRVRA
jgi:cytochrome c1